MKLKSVEKVAGWEYLSRYDVKYETPSGGEKVYEMFSRDPGIDSPEKLLHPRTDAVMIIMTDKTCEHLLLIREFRLELGREIYGLPAGLIDPGETPEQTAKRELKEETGLDLVEIRHVLAARVQRGGTFKRAVHLRVSAWQRERSHPTRRRARK